MRPPATKPSEAPTAEPTPAPRPFGLSHDAWGRLVLIDADGVRHSGVEPIRAFPISDPGRWISLCDPNGREIVSVDSLENLAPGVRQVIEEELAVREFVPVIRKILRVSSDICPSDWHVETDRGPTRFTLDSEEDVRRLGAHRVLITDSQRLRYHVPDILALDSVSRRILERYA